MPPAQHRPRRLGQPGATALEHHEHHTAGNESDECRQERRGQLGLLQPDPGSEPGVNHRRELRPGLSRASDLDPLDRSSHDDPPSPLAAAATSRGVIRPIVGKYAHWSWWGSIVAGSMNTVAPSRRALPYSGDQVADATSRQCVLGREQPVVAGQAHLAAQRHRFPQQPPSGREAAPTWRPADF